MGGHVAHTTRGHGLAEVASSRRRNLPVLVGGRYLDTVVGQGAELGPGWRRRGGLPGCAPRTSHRLAVDCVPSPPNRSSLVGSGGLEVRPLEDGPGFRLGHGMEVRSVCLPNLVIRSILEGLHFTHGTGADVWAAVHRQLPDALDTSLQPPGHDPLVGMEWRLWAANVPCPPVVMWPGKSGLGPSWETIVVVCGSVTIRGVGGHAFTAPCGKAVDTDGRVAL